MKACWKYLIAAASVSVALSSQADLITNGSFEDLPASGWGAPSPATIATGWEGLAGGEGVVRALAVPLSPTNIVGVYVGQVSYTSEIEIAPAARPSVSAGTDYVLSMLMGTLGDFATDIGNAQVDVVWYDGNTTGAAEVSRSSFSYDMTSGAYNLNLQGFSETVTAPAGATFAAVNVSKSIRGGGNDGILIDDVQFAVVPEPATLGLLLAGGLLVALRRRSQV